MWYWNEKTARVRLLAKWSQAVTKMESRSQDIIIVAKFNYFFLTLSYLCYPQFSRSDDRRRKYSFFLKQKQMNNLFIRQKWNFIYSHILIELTEFLEQNSFHFLRPMLRAFLFSLISCTFMRHVRESESQRPDAILTHASITVAISRRSLTPYYRRNMEVPRHEERNIRRAAADLLNITL